MNIKLIFKILRFCLKKIFEIVKSSYNIKCIMNDRDWNDYLKIYDNVKIL